MFFEIFIQMMPYLAVFAVLGYIGRVQQKKAKESFLYTLNKPRDWHRKIPQVNLDYYWPGS